MNKTIILGGAEYKVAPLRSLQVAEFYDAIDAAADGETKVATITRSLRTIARSMRNENDTAFPSDEDENTAISRIDALALFAEIDPAFGIVLEISGLKKAAAGEAQAADESTSSASSAASSAS